MAKPCNLCQSRAMELTPEIEAARNKWQYDGSIRPEFAEPTAPDEESVWDFPRPPRIEAHPGRLMASSRGTMLAASDAGVRILETAGAPTYYFPSDDCSRLLRLGRPQSVCEWKGLAASVEHETFGVVGWSYVDVFPEFESVLGWISFYPTAVECRVDSEVVTPQPGGYYGGWVTTSLRGPIKGAPGTEDW